MGQTALGHCAVDHVRSALHQAALIGILNAKNKGSAAVAGNEPGIQRGAQVSHVHIAGGGGGEPCADFPLWNPGFHLLKKMGVKRHNNTSGK